MSNFINLTLKKGGTKVYIDVDSIAAVYSWETSTTDWSGTYILMKGPDHSLVVQEGPETVMEMIGRTPL